MISDVEVLRIVFCSVRKSLSIFVGFIANFIQHIQCRESNQILLGIQFTGIMDKKLIADIQIN